MHPRPLTHLPTCPTAHLPDAVNAMEWIPVFLFTFKILVLGIGMFFAIKWHYDQDRMKAAQAKSTGPTPPARPD